MTKSPYVTLLLIVAGFFAILIPAACYVYTRAHNTSQVSDQMTMAKVNEDDPGASNSPDASVADLPQTVVISDAMFDRDQVPMATRDFADIGEWRKTLGDRLIGGGQDISGPPDNSYVQSRLVQESRIIPIANGTTAHLISINKDQASVEITQGVNAGCKGLVYKYCLYRTDGPPPRHLFTMPGDNGSYFQ